jgi:orotate phosphoribosyltransferase
MLDYQKDFIAYALSCGVLKFGQFQLKSGRSSPYFFNTGLFNTGARLERLGHFYARALLNSGLKVDILYGPAYKGIPLVSATAIAYARLTAEDMPYAFNRKEAKDHGEGGLLVGSALRGRVLILDDVITAGTSIRESIEIIGHTSATPVGVLLALDRQEKGTDSRSATQQVSEQFALPVHSIISLAQIIEFLQTHPDSATELKAIETYQRNYGI